jgi:hypothetical protein
MSGCGCGRGVGGFDGCGLDDVAVAKFATLVEGFIEFNEVFGNAEAGKGEV